MSFPNFEYAKITFVNEKKNPAKVFSSIRVVTKKDGSGKLIRIVAKSLSRCQNYNEKLEMAMGRTRRKRKRNVKFRLDNSDFINLVKWMRIRTKLKMRYFKETGRGLCCGEKIDPGGVLVSIPLRLMITPKSLNESIRVSEYNSSPQLNLSVFLMYERHLDEKSRYHRYIKILPTSYSTLFFCRDDEAEHLPDFLLQGFLQMKRHVRDYYEKIGIAYSSKPCPHCGVHLDKIFDYSSFTWAWFTVNTRCVYYKDRVQDTLALAPLLDMFNHSSDAANEITVDQEKKSYVLRTLKPCRKMREIFIKYGSHSNLKLLNEYGFITENNPHDSVEFTFDEVLAGLKEYKREYGDITGGKYKFIIKNNLNKNLTKNMDEYSWNLNALLYVVVTRDENLAVINAKCFGGEFDEFECSEIKTVTEMLREAKKLELSRALNKMKSVEKPSQSFELAQKLVQIYINLLEY